LAQLANIPGQITLYELFRLSKSTKKALREELIDYEVFLAQFLPSRGERRWALSSGLQTFFMNHILSRGYANKGET